MANPHRGEVDLVVGERTYVLRMSINEIAQLETLLDKGVNEISAILSDGDNPKLWVWRAAFWAALQGHHKGTALEDAGEIMAEAGFPAIMGAVGEALQAAFPSNEGGRKRNPRKASRAGTGKA